MHAHIVEGEKSLFVNPTFTNYIEGFSLEESRYILELLYTHSIAPERYTEPRLMHRVTVVRCVHRDMSHLKVTPCRPVTVRSGPLAAQTLFLSRKS